MNQLNFNPFPNFSTERLEFRQLNKVDAISLSILRSNNQANQYIDRPKTKTLNESLEFIYKTNKRIENNEILYWALTKKGEKKIIGTFCMWNFRADNFIAEIGYELFPKYQGEGFTSEALREILNYSFNTLNLKSVEAYTHKNNIASLKILEKNFFSYDKNLKDESNPNNLIYNISAEEYYAKIKKE